nr:hypothetical protein CPGR_00402 [Mycolicibacter nonchromogenicus]
MYNGMMAKVDATRRVVTRYGIGRMASDSIASISSEIRIEPSWAVNRHPACAANASAAMIGASSRVDTVEDSRPAAGSIPNRCRAW